MRVGSFERQVRLAVVGGVLFLLFLAALSLVVLRNVASWGIGESRAAAVSRTRRVAERLERGGNPTVALGADAAVASVLRDVEALGAAVYDDAGSRLAEATFLPEAGLSPAKLPAPARPRDGGALVEEESRPGAARVVVFVTLTGGHQIVRVVYDGSARAAARRNVLIVSWIVPLASLLLVLLVFPFFRRFMRPIDALTETARDAGAVVPGEPSSGDETERAIATFQRTIEELKVRSAELEELRQREKRRADELAVRAESLVLSTTRLERELSSQRELARLGEMSAGHRPRVPQRDRGRSSATSGSPRQTDDPAARARHLAARRSRGRARRARHGRLPPLRAARAARRRADRRRRARRGDRRRSAPAVTPPVGIAVEGDVRARPTIDAALFRRALVNLVRNAGEAAARAASCFAARRAPEGTRSRWPSRTTARASPPEVLPKLFMPFFSTKESGTGLGLALVAKIVALHGGEVSVGRSAALGGARFVLSVPRTPLPPLHASVRAGTTGRRRAASRREP